MTNRVVFGNVETVLLVVLEPGVRFVGLNTDQNVVVDDFQSLGFRLIIHLYKMYIPSKKSYKIITIF